MFIHPRNSMSVGTGTSFQGIPELLFEVIID
jgi:hypothetical protein